MLRNLLFTTFLFSFIFISSGATKNALGDDSDFLDNVTVITSELGANDIVYDQNRNLLYASVPATAGLPNGNCIVTLNPENLEVIDRVLIGSEPNQMAISSDGSRIYVGIDGAQAIRYYEPLTGDIGPLWTLNDTSIAQDLAVAPDDPSTVVVSSNTRGISSEGFIEVFNDSGRVDYIDYPYGPTSINFLNANTMYGSGRSFNGLFHFDGQSLRFETQGRYGITTKSETSGGMIFVRHGSVYDGETLASLGRFSNVEGLIEPSVRDGLVYFLVRDKLHVFSVDNFLELDSKTLPISNERSRRSGALVFAGANRLAYVKEEDGQIGIISGVLISEKPMPQLTVRGTAENDECVFNGATRELIINGEVKKIPYEVSRLFFNGLGGDDSLRFIGDENADEYAVLKNGSLVVDSERTFFSAFNMEDVRFEADELSNDISVVFDSADDETIFVRPNKLSMETADGSIETNNRGRTIVYSSGNGDRAVMRGGPGDENFRVNFGQKRVLMTGENQTVELNGFGEVYINAGLDGDDRAIAFDSPNQDYLFSFGDLNRLSNSDGDSYIFKGFSYFSVASLGGDDIAFLQKTSTSRTRGNSRWNSIFDTFFDNNVFNFFRVDVLE